MFLQRTTSKILAISLFMLLFTSAGATQQQTIATAQDENERSIIADEFLKNRRAQGKTAGKKNTYRLATSRTKRSDQSELQVGVTIWRLEPATDASLKVERSASGSYWNTRDWIPRRVEADVAFRKGDNLRISIESPRKGYLYVVNRDVLADGTYGETNLIFPTQGEDNWLQAGKLIDLPAQNKPPFKAAPTSDQSSELLTIIVTSSPLPLRLGPKAIPISEKQLRGWEERWGGQTARLEMNGGAGQARTTEEDLAASPTRARQLTRDDPMPQTIYSLVPKNTNGLLFNVVLSYIR